MLKKILPVIIITVCLLFAGCKAPADQEQKNNTETAVLSTETQEEDWKQVHSTQKDLEKLPQKIQKIFSDNQTFFDVEKGKEYDKNSFIKTLIAFVLFVFLYYWVVVGFSHFTENSALANLNSFIFKWGHILFPILTIINWVLTYFRLKESEVIHRM